jgi:ABC-type sugar transport system substrate-binding protein
MNAVNESFHTDHAEEKEIYVILPDNPKYFWHRAYGVLKQAPCPVTLKLFSAIRQEQGEALVEEYIEQAVASNARALIVAVHSSERLRKRLGALANHMLVIQLCEYTAISNTFFVGGDGRADGRTLASCIRTDSDRPLNIGVMTGALSHAGRERIQGFLSALPSSARVFFVEKPTVVELYASHLARAIDALDIPLDYFFSFDGITTAACDALYKLRGKMKTQLLGFEYPTTAEKHMEEGRIAALAVQAPDRQMQIALKLAERYVRERVYPDGKYCYVPSQILQADCEESVARIK